MSRRNPVSTPRRPSSSRTLAVGSYTPATGGRGIGISIVAADERGCLRLLSETPCESPSFLTHWAPSRTLFAANETPSGEVSSFHVHARGTLSAIDVRPSMGGRPCHL